ncbi:MAG: diacylglycerol kinase family protein [Terracidiphilus sp.]|jgi:YegS/Rv2252/BmrU family lipid kinase
MRRVALIYNPASGQYSSRRRRAVEQAAALLQVAGIDAETVETLARGSAGTLAEDAVRRGCDTIIACGGDGTVNEVLQSIVGTEVALGVLPLGTANALAANLGLNTSPVKAMRRLLAAEPVCVSVGRISFGNGTENMRSLYFTVAAGVGADALFLSRLDAGRKRRLGYALYLVEALRVWATHSFPLFEAVFEECGTCLPRTVEISQLLAVRIRDFGGVLHNLAPGATLHNDGLRLLAFKTRSRYQYFRFLLAVLFGRQTFSRQVELLDAVSVECRPRNRSRTRVFAEADGELLGHLPVRIEIVPQALNLLIPANARP